jgi:DNA-binding response OmpR family regulator
VDDSATVRAMVSELLTGAGYRVAAAESAEAAAKLVQGGTVPKLFVLDVNMPGTDGFGLCKALRAHAQTAGVPVVFLTGKTGLLSKLHGRWVGAAEYMTKPFQPDKLLATVGRLAPLAHT